MKRALVTGCAGFIGSTLTETLLGDGYEVTGIDCFTDYYPREIKEANLSRVRRDDRFTFIEGDLSSIDRFPDVDVIFHQAAQAGVRSSWGANFDIYINHNIRATQRMLEHYKEAGLEKFVYASSSSIYGDSPLPMREDSVPKPVSPYGVTKLACEHLCYLYFRNYGIPTVSLRYFTVYGPRQRPDMAISKFVRSIGQGEPIIVYGDGSQTRDFTYVDDIVRANLLAAGSNSAGEAFNIGGGSRISVAGLITTIEEAMGKKARISYDTKQKGDVVDTLADNSRAKLKLGWSPKVDIATGVKRYVDWRTTTGIRQPAE